jgi:hypothetical protein
LAGQGFVGASLPPDAADLVGSLRAFGYGLADALGDLVDNSVAADAGRVSIEFSSDVGRAWIAVVDNGRGMYEDDLHEAMRFARGGPHLGRREPDLGRFGLGLKTASLSHAGCLTVLSARQSAPLAARTWDVQVITERRDWYLLTEPDPEAVSVADSLSFSGPGTLVLWRRLDVGLEGPALARKLGEAGQQLGVLFHRQISAGTLVIRLGGRRVPPWDPFLLHHPATQDLGTEILEHGEVRAKVHPVVLPHPGRLHPTEQKAAAGPRGMIAHQGFYVYRGGRLLQAGGWLGLPGLPMTPLTRLARLAVDFDTADDLAWAVDVRKASMRPPAVLEKRLTQLAEHARGVSERVFTHRGGRQAESPGGHTAAVWRQYQLGGRTGYLINRLHPLVASALQQPTPGKLEAVLRLAEVTLPVRLIAQEAVTDAAADRSTGADIEEDEVHATLRQVLTALPAEGTERVELLRALAATDPFVRYPALVAEILDSDSPQEA